jgi:heme/copper-type cytochrome/quinol oxidase subunit 2
MSKREQFLLRLCMKLSVTLIAGVIFNFLPQLASAQPSARQDDDFLRIAKECDGNKLDPFRSVSDIRREVDCVAAAMKARGNSARTFESPVIWILARNARWEYRYGLDGALQNIPACVVTSGIVLPVGRPIKVNLTSKDTIHEWSFPTLGIKATAIPGRIEALTLQVETKGTAKGVIVRDEGTPRSRSTPVTLRFLGDAEYAAWERRTLRSRGCGRGLDGKWRG